MNQKKINAWWIFIAIMALVDVFIVVNYLKLMRVNKVVERYEITVKEYTKINEGLNAESPHTEEDPQKIDELRNRMHFIQEDLHTAGEILEKAVKAGKIDLSQLADHFLDRADKNLKAVEKELENYKKLKHAQP